MLGSSVSDSNFLLMPPLGRLKALTLGSLTRKKPVCVSSLSLLQPRLLTAFGEQTSRYLKNESPNGRSPPTSPQPRSSRLPTLSLSLAALFSLTK